MIGLGILGKYQTVKPNDLIQEAMTVLDPAEKAGRKPSRLEQKEAVRLVCCATIADSESVEWEIVAGPTLDYTLTRVSTVTESVCVDTNALRSTIRNNFTRDPMKAILAKKDDDCRGRYREQKKAELEQKKAEERQQKQGQVTKAQTNSRVA